MSNSYSSIFITPHEIWDKSPAVTGQLGVVQLKIAGSTMAWLGLLIWLGFQQDHAHGRLPLQTRSAPKPGDLHHFAAYGEFSHPAHLLKFIGRGQESSLTQAHHSCGECPGECPGVPGGFLVPTFQRAFHHHRLWILVNGTFGAEGRDDWYGNRMRAFPNRTHVQCFGSTRPRYAPGSSSSSMPGCSVWNCA